MCQKLLIGFFSLALSLPLFAEDKTVVAKVNGEEITKKELEKSFRENMMFVSDKIVSKEKVLYDMINRQLGIARARKNKIQEDPAVQEKLNDILYHAQISKDLEPKLKKIEVTEQDVKNYYKDHKEYRTAQILFRVRADPAEEEYKAALKKALEVSKKAKANPDKFAELANKYSQTNTAKNGGDMGFQPAVRLAPEYYKAIKGEKPGLITSPVRSQFGYHIIKVMAVKDYEDINKTVYKKEIRSKAKIKINKENL